jgi:hypothetical protein
MCAINSAVPCGTGLILLILTRTDVLGYPGLTCWATCTPSLRDYCVLPVRYPASLSMVLGACFRRCAN